MSRLEEDISRRRSLFENYLSKQELGQVDDDVILGRHTCPCCGYPTIKTRGAQEICGLCQWQDDGQDDPFADQMWGGPNGDYPLSEARENFASQLTMYRKSDPRYEDQSMDIRTGLKRQIMMQYEAAMRNGLTSESGDRHSGPE